MRTLAVGLALVLLSGCVSTTTRPLPAGDPGTVGLASLEKVRLGGVDQWILIRGTDRTAPLILKVHGGPGQAEMAAVGLNAPLEQDFLVVEWDQRGAGKSAAAVEPTSAMTLEQISDDTVELSRMLLARFEQKRLMLVGHSWGSVVALRAAQKAPELFRAVVTTGLIADTRAGWPETYQWLLDEAGRRGNAEALRQLHDLGPPPYEGAGAADRRQKFGRWVDALNAAWHRGPPDRTRWMIDAPEYSWPEKLGYGAAADRSFGLLWPDLAAVDLKKQVPRLGVPLFVAAGRDDHLAPTDLAEAWFAAVKAPHKVWRWFDQSGHFPMFEEAGPFELFLEEVQREAGD